VGKGSYCSTVALLTAALKHSSEIGRVELTGLPASLKLLIENEINYDMQPGLYCFGLLRDFDIREYVGMACPANIHISETIGSCQRAEKEFKQLEQFFRKNHAELKFE
jgi:hypothetical protein